MSVSLHGRLRIGFAMVTSNSKTDRELSISAGEFVWDSGSQSEAHLFLVCPILNLLNSAKAKQKVIRN